MENNLSNRLKELAGQVDTTPDSPDNTTILIEAFQLFSKETQRLRASYDALKGEFKEVHQELEGTNTELKKKVAQLDTISHYLHSILSNITQGIVFVDLNGIITTFNKAAERILERDQLDTLFSSYWDHFDDRAFGFSMGEALASKEAPSSLYITFDTPSKEIREMELHTHFILQGPEGYQVQEKDSLEVIQGMILVLRDYTETNRLRRIAHRNDRMKELGEMAGMVAHEVRNPLGGIKGFAALLERDLADQPRLAKIAHNIMEGADHLNRLVTEVLNYSRSVDLMIEPLDLATLAHDIHNHYQTAHPEGRVAFHISGPEEGLTAPVDRHQLSASLLNMIVNGCEAMPKGGDLYIDIGEEQGSAVITIRDTGEGIAAENIEKIFSPFFTTKVEGNGFGLSEAHKIIQAHEGTIEVHSELGKGSTFIVRIPSKPFARNQ